MTAILRIATASTARTFATGVALGISATFLPAAYRGTIGRLVGWAKAKFSSSEEEAAE
jgi:lauroyl/myristoyl acyltransferase